MRKQTSQNTTAPSKILGSIKADGSVYVINQSGIIFGGTSQVNVGALIASTAKITDCQFLNGIYSTQTGNTWTPSFSNAAGNVKVEAGALISTNDPSSVTAGGGSISPSRSVTDSNGRAAAQWTAAR